MSNNPADNMYCMVSFADKDGKSHGNHPQILEIQGVVWFATEELAREYYMMLKPELRDNDNVFPMQEEQLSWHFDVNSSYVKHMDNGMMYGVPMNMISVAKKQYIKTPKLNIGRVA